MINKPVQCKEKTASDISSNHILSEIVPQRVGHA